MKWCRSRLPFKRIWHGDFEFTEGNTGNRPVPLCATFSRSEAAELVQLWQDEMRHGEPPIVFDTGFRLLRRTW